MQQVGAHVAAQIAVGDHAGELAGRLGDGHATKAFGRHFDDRFRHRCAARNQRDGGARMHHVADEFQCSAQSAAGMEDPEIDRGEAATFKERNGKRIAERELHQ